MTFNLRKHQQEALEWMEGRESQETRRGGILALEMGLGKTRTSLALCSRKEGEKSLIVCSKSLLSEWIREYREVFGNLEGLFVLHYEHQSERLDRISDETILSHNMVLTTYDVLVSACRRNGAAEQVSIRDGVKFVGFRHTTEPALDAPTSGKNVIYSTVWDRIVTDESQVFSNSKTARFSAVNAVHANCRWCLTGTPMRNNDGEAWSLFWFCGFDMISSPHPKHGWNFKCVKQYNLGDLIHHRKCTDVGLSPPNLKLITFDCALSTHQETVYEHFYKILKQQLCIFKNNPDPRDKEIYAAILASLMRLRMVCLSPYLILHEGKYRKKPLTSCEKREDKEMVEVTGVEMADVNIRFTPKAQYVASVASSIVKKTKDKLVIFSQFTSYLHYLKSVLSSHDISSEVLDGNLSSNERMELLEEFRSEECPFRVMFINLNVGATGLNLQVANRVMVIEPYWNAAMESQAIARVARMGQKKPVTLYRVLCRGTIEEAISDLAAGKEELMKSYFTGERDESIVQPKLDYDTIQKIIQREALSRPSRQITGLATAI